MKRNLIRLSIIIVCICSVNVLAAIEMNESEMSAIYGGCGYCTSGPIQCPGVEVVVNGNTTYTYGSCEQSSMVCALTSSDACEAYSGPCLGSRSAYWVTVVDGVVVDSGEATLYCRSASKSWC